MPPQPGPHMTLLLDIHQKLGEHGAQLNLILLEQANAQQARARTYERLDKIERETASIKASIDRIAPLVDDHEKTRQRRIGGETRQTLIIGAVMTLLTFLAGIWAKLAGHWPFK